MTIFKSIKQLISPPNEFIKPMELHDFTDGFLRYPNEDSPWQIETIKFTNGRIGYRIWVLRTDNNCCRWCNLISSNPYEKYSHSDVILGIEQFELMSILRCDFDLYENWFDIMFNTLEEAKRFIDEYSHHYETTYVANILSGVN